MDKLVFAKAEKNICTQATHIRIAKDQYDQIKTISSETGLSVFETSRRLLQFAIDNTEIKEITNE